MITFNLTKLEPICQIPYSESTPPDWLSQLNIIFSFDAHPQFDTNNPYILKLYQYLTDKHHWKLDEEQKQALMTSVQQLLDSSPDVFSKKLTQLIDELEFPQSKESLLHECMLQFIQSTAEDNQTLYICIAQRKGLLNAAPDFNLLHANFLASSQVQTMMPQFEYEFTQQFQPFQVFYTIKHHLIQKLTAHFGYKGYQPDGYPESSYQQWLRLLKPLLANPDEAYLKRLLTYNETEQVCDIHWNEFLVGLVCCYTTHGIIDEAQADFIFIANLLRDGHLLPLKSCNTSLKLFSNMDELACFLSFINSFELQTQIFIDILGIMDDDDDKLESISKLFAKLKQNKMNDLISHLVSSLDQRFNIGKILFEHELSTQPRIAELLESNTDGFEHLLVFLGNQPSQKVYELFKLRNAHHVPFFENTCYYYDSQFKVMLTQCEQFTSEQIFSIFAEPSDNNSQFLHNVLNFTVGDFTYLVSWVKNKLTADQQILLLSHQNNKLENLLLKACRRHPEHLPILLNWTQQLEPALRFAIFSQADDTEHLDLLTTVLQHHPESLPLFLQHFEQLPPNYQRICFGHLAKKQRNILHFADKCSQPQFENLISTIKRADANLVSSLLLRQDIEANCPIFDLLKQNKEILEPLLAEISSCTPLQQQQLFALSNTKQETFISLLLNHGIQKFTEWLPKLLESSDEPIAKNLAKLFSEPCLMHSDYDRYNIIWNFLVFDKTSHINLKHMAHGLTLPSQIENISVFYGCVFKLYESNSSLLKKLKIVTDLTVKASFSNNTLVQQIQLLSHNVYILTHQVPLLNQVMRSLLHTRLDSFSLLSQSLVAHPYTLDAILDYKPEDGLSLLQFCIHKQVNIALYETLLQTYIIRQKLFDTLQQENGQGENVVEFAARKASLFFNAIIENLPSLSRDEQLVLIAGNKNILLHCINKAPFALENTLKQCTVKLGPIFEVCLSEASIWQTSIEKQDGSLQMLCSSIETLRPETILSILESQNEHNRKCIYELLPHKLQQALRQISPVQHAAFSMFNAADTNQEQASKKQHTMPPQ